MKNDFTQEIICDKLFAIRTKPDNMVMCKAINLYNNRYRINVYTEHESENLVYRKIGYSCFATLDDDVLNIVDETPNYNISA